MLITLEKALATCPPRRRTSDRISNSIGSLWQHLFTPVHQTGRHLRNKEGSSPVPALSCCFKKRNDCRALSVLAHELLVSRAGQDGKPQVLMSNHNRPRTTNLDSTDTQNNRHHRLFIHPWQGPGDVTGHSPPKGQSSPQTSPPMAGLAFPDPQCCGSRAMPPLHSPPTATSKRLAIGPFKKANGTYLRGKKPAQSKSNISTKKRSVIPPNIYKLTF